MGWQDVLLSADVLWSPVAVGRIRLDLPSGIQQELRLASVQGPLYPRAAGRLVSESSEPTLIIADSASRDVVELVRRSGQSIVTASGRVLLQLAIETVEGDASRVTRPARARGPK